MADFVAPGFNPGFADCTPHTLRLDFGKGNESYRRVVQKITIGIAVLAGVWITRILIADSSDCTDFVEVTIHPDRQSLTRIFFNWKQQAIFAIPFQLFLQILPGSENRQPWYRELLHPVRSEI